MDAERGQNSAPIYRQLRYEHGRLLTEAQPVDLVYNRLVDFSFDNPEHQDLRAAYLDDAVVVTPNPRVHADGIPDFLFLIKERS